MTYVKFVWSEKEKVERQWKTKSLLSLPIRLKKAEANFQRRLNKK